MLVRDNPRIDLVASRLTPELLRKVDGRLAAVDPDARVHDVVRAGLFPLPAHLAKEQLHLAPGVAAPYVAMAASEPGSDEDGIELGESNSLLALSAI